MVSREEIIKLNVLNRKIVSGLANDEEINFYNVRIAEIEMEKLTDRKEILEEISKKITDENGEASFDVEWLKKSVLMID